VPLLVPLRAGRWFLGRWLPAAVRWLAGCCLKCCLQKNQEICHDTLGAGSLAAGCLLRCCCPLAGWLLFEMFHAKKIKKYAMTSTRRHLTKEKKQQASKGLIISHCTHIMNR
jgi:hypothetical protein